MENEIVAPWATGPAEILKHALSLLDEDTDANRRLAMISIDNAVELMIKTYLTLPSRITGLNINRTVQREFSESFPKLLDALEEYASDKLIGINLGTIEFYHRIRNQLYHEDIGLTVTRNNVDVYAEIANILFNNLFGFFLVEPEEDRTELLGEFILGWVGLEKALYAYGQKAYGLDPKRRVPMIEILRILKTQGIIPEKEYLTIMRLRHYRNEIVHGVKEYEDALTVDLVNKIKALTNEIKRRGESAN